ncbi:uncharacterized protein At4g15970-like [Ziziphus jujuba]|uniref:Uncharacterized protein At4g15970-like n=3 Tax=Ziziphus jujuba TaxID=326968 RepID=A0A6P4A6G0_ZIZJJ|nr:uncharacterized protein At4g15970-like [Ziziphus jujuba]XP_015883762.3 uncharacterized protein At4g15970-like [Ziziphus jujuba]
MVYKAVGLEFMREYNRISLVRAGVLFLVVLLACLVLYNNPLPKSYVFYQDKNTIGNAFEVIIINKNPLDTILENSSMEDKTVIITNLNDAWAEPNSIFDLFLESFRIGNDTERLLNHLMVICLDEMAYNRCLALHPHCYRLHIEGFNFTTSNAFFMSPAYLEIVWRKIEFLATVLEKGYNFVFSDTDVMWLRDPFPRFYPDADIQVSCDSYFGDSTNVHNLANTGFSYVKSNNRTIQFYKFWNESRERFPTLHDQRVFDKIKYDPFIRKSIGLKMRFHDTDIFGGFCNPSKDLNLVCTMHANCCLGLRNKVRDLHILLEDWRKFKLMDPILQPNASWSVPQHCRIPRRSNPGKKNSQT